MARLVELGDAGLPVSPETPAVGWHPDSDRIAERYWTGSAWSDWRIRKDVGLAPTLRRLMLPALVGLALIFACVQSGISPSAVIAEPINAAAVMVCQITVALIGILLALVLVTPQVGSVIVGSDDVLFCNLRRKRCRLSDIDDAFAYERDEGQLVLCIELQDGRTVMRSFPHLPHKAVAACAADIRRRLGSLHGESLPGDPSPSAENAPESDVSSARRAAHGRGWYPAPDSPGERYWEGSSWQEFRLRQRREGSGATAGSVIVGLLLILSAVLQLRLIVVVTGLVGLGSVVAAFTALRELSTTITLTSTGVIVSKRLRGKLALARDVAYSYEQLADVLVEPKAPAWSLCLRGVDGTDAHLDVTFERATANLCSAQMRSRLHATM